jgi:EpsI family protein
MHQESTEKKWWLPYIFPALILGVFLIGYWSVFQKLFFRWEGGDDSYCYLIVPLFIYLLWDMRAKRNKRCARSRLASGSYELPARREDREPRSLEDGGDDLDVGGKGFFLWPKAKRSSNLTPPEASASSEAVVPLPSEAVEQFRFGEFSWSAWGLVPVALSVLLIIIGEIVSVETLLYTGVWGCVAGAMAVLYGKRVRHLYFSLFILLFIVPLPPFINRMLTFKLKLYASALSAILLRLTGVSVVQQGNIIDLGISQLQVVDACSGLRYLMPLLLTALLVGYFFNKRLWQKTSLIAVVVPLSIFVNAVRIWVTGILTTNGYGRLAQSFFHDFSGWLIYMIAGAFLIAAALVLKRLSKEEREKRKEDKIRIKGQGLRIKEIGSVVRRSSACPVKFFEEKQRSGFNRGRPSSSKWAKPVVLTIVLCLLFAVSGWALKEIPSAGNLLQRAAFDSFPMQVGQWQGDRYYLSKEVVDYLGADDYVGAIYKQPGREDQINLLIPFYAYQGTRHTAHAPQSCMLGAGWGLFHSSERLVNLNPYGKIKIMTMIWEKGGYKLLGSYFFFQRGRVITSPWLNKLYLMKDAFTKRRTDGALVRMEMTVSPGRPMDEAYQELEGFIEKLWPILPKYIPL